MIASAIAIVVYIVIYYAVLSILVLSSLSLLGLLYSGRFHIDWADEHAASYLIMVPVCLVVTYFILSGGFGYPPPFLRSQGEVLDQSAVAAKLDSLEEESRKLTQALDNLDALTLKEIREIIKDSLGHLQDLEQEAIEQEQLLRSLRSIRSKELVQYQEQQEQAELVTSISDEQLEAVKLLITQDATDISSKVFWFGVAVSFFVGFSSSLAASKVRGKG